MRSPHYIKGHITQHLCQKTFQAYMSYFEQGASGSASETMAQQSIMEQLTAIAASANYSYRDALLAVTKNSKSTQRSSMPLHVTPTLIKV